jgi:hypothetical protein
LKQNKESAPSSSGDTKLIRQKVKLIDSQDKKVEDNTSSGSSIDAQIDGTMD